ncbi:MAG: pyridoxamine 5'-phosphate oxidase [Alphaproteobacteria bacterium]|nr:pyridoxamine 5'-phosphate oxidase [Alphaproteobacteria bacterium]
MFHHNEPFGLFGEWFAEARRAETVNPDAVCLATVAADGMPSARMVLLKSFDAAGFVFYSNGESAKATDIAGHPVAALCAYWKALGRQVRVDGAVAPVPAVEADAYFATRARGSQLGAWASQQSRPVDSRETLVARVAALERTWQGRAVPRPPYWGGWRLLPRRIEFWVDRPDRLHDRLLFERAGEGWTRQRLQP